jgi:hypothetical protein
VADVYDLLASAVIVIREDDKLREAFNKILGAGHGDQRVPLLLAEIRELNAPEKIVQFVRLLSDDRISALVLNEINRG